MENDTNKEEKNQDPADDKKQASQPPLLEDPILVTDFLQMMLASLETKAWAYLGKIAHPETQKQHVDLAQARLAIDAVAALYQNLENSLSPDEKKDLQVRISNLRLNFAK